MIITVREVLCSDIWNWTFNLPVGGIGGVNRGIIISSRFKSCITTGLSGNPIPDWFLDWNIKI
jgi:hypothetical protein